jgi:hypothetical protein
MLHHGSGGLLLPEATEAPRDAELFKKLTAAAGDADIFYESLNPVGDLQTDIKDHFGDSERSKEPFAFDRYAYVRPENSTDFAVSEAKLRLFKDEIRASMRDEADPDQRLVLQLYRWKVNEYIAKARMVQLAGAQKGETFERFNQFVYGKPDAEVFAAVCSEFRTTATDALSSQHEHVRKAAQQVLALVPDQAGDRAILRPDSETFARVREAHYGEDGYYTLLFAGVDLPEKEPIKPAVGEPILRQVQHNIGADHYKRVPTAAKAWSVNHVDQELRGPGEYSMPLKRFIGLPAGHEFGTHVLETINGGRQPLRLLSLGLDRNERGEGRAVGREQVPYETFDEFAKLLRWNDILRRHFVSGMMAGLHEGDASLDAIIRTLYAVDTLREVMAKPDAPEAANMKALDRTASLVARVYGRGIYKDTAYLEGNIDAWRHSERISDGDKGKYDIANERHVTALRQLGILAAA